MKATLAPCSANFSAILRPMPFEAPVMRAVFPSNNFIICKMIPGGEDRYLVGKVSKVGKSGRGYVSVRFSGTPILFGLAHGVFRGVRECSCQGSAY